MAVQLDPTQLEAISNIRNGSILAGEVGSGKSRAALAYFLSRVCLEKIPINGSNTWVTAKAPRKLYIVTTAMKRNRQEWDTEMVPFGLPRDDIPVVVDSWNNMHKYTDVKDAFFIFDEQRLIGSGQWVKSFLKIAKGNQWIMLSATPGDNWMDYIPVFVANGYYKNRSDFLEKHVVFSRFTQYPKVEKVLGTKRLNAYRKELLVEMPVDRHTVRHSSLVPVEFDKNLYKKVVVDRWNPYTMKPIQQAGELYYTLRKVVNSDPSRLTALEKLHSSHSRMILFYNYDYELELLKEWCKKSSITFSEWNGHTHGNLPTGESWVYLVQYTAGAEGWNCVETDTVVFYSTNPANRIVSQAMGRIDRRNTPFVDLYYYTLRGNSQVDMSIWKALKTKKRFSERAFEKSLGFDPVGKSGQIGQKKTESLAESD